MTVLSVAISAANFVPPGKLALQFALLSSTMRTLGAEEVAAPGGARKMSVSSARTATGPVRMPAANKRAQIVFMAGFRNQVGQTCPGLRVTRTPWCATWVAPVRGSSAVARTSQNDSLGAEAAKEAL